MDEVKEFYPDTQESMDLKKIEALYHVTRELSGVIMEYAAMPCESLERRMISTAQRYREKIRDNAPSITLEEWNDRENASFIKWKQFTEDVKASE